MSYAIELRVGMSELVDSMLLSSTFNFLIVQVLCMLWLVG